MPTPDPETIKSFYHEIIRQNDILFRSLDNLNNKSIAIIAFNGTLLSLSSLSIVQLVKDSNMDLTIFFVGISIAYSLIIISIAFAAYAFRVVSINTVNTKELHNEYYTEKNTNVLDQLCSNIADDIEENNKIAKDKSTFINVSLLFSIMGVLTVCIFLIYGFIIIHNNVGV